MLTFVYTLPEVSDIMAPNRRRSAAGAAAAGASSGKKQKTQQDITGLLGSKKMLLTGLNKKYKGQRILLKASDLYARGRVPRGEEDYLFQYTIKSINDDCKTAVIEFDEQYIIDGGDKFVNYPKLDEDGADSGDEADDDDAGGDIKDYQISLAKDDMERYRKHIARRNKAINDIKFAKLKEDAAKKVAVSDDVSDLQQQIKDGTLTAYQMLLAEFKETGTLEGYTVQSGPHAGTTNYKQVWEHVHSKTTLTWHRSYGKSTFQSDRLWKACRAIIKAKQPGWKRCELILSHSKLPLDTSASGKEKFPREMDMPNRVNAVFGLVGGRLVLSAFDGGHLRRYLGGLEERHRPPHRLERCRLMEVMIDKAFMEFGQIAKVCVVL